MNHRRPVCAWTLSLSLVALAGSPSAAQTTLSPMARWMVKLSGIRQELQTVKIPAYYCKPPKMPQKPPDVSKLRTIDLDLREAENELRAIESAFRKELPHGQRLEGDDPRIKNFPPIGRVDVTAEGTTPGSVGVPYFAAAWRVFHDAKTAHRVKQDIVEKMDPVTCVDPGEGGQKPQDDPIGFLKPPRYYPIMPPRAAACYETSEAKRGPYSRAFEEEQEANTNINMADAHVQAIRDLQVHYANQDGAADIRARLRKLLEEADADRTVRRAEWDAAYARLNEIVAAPIPCPKTAGQVPAAQPRSRITILGGTGFGTGGTAPVTPLTAGPPMAVPGNRTQTTVPTLLVHPGKRLLNEIIDLLDEADWLDYFGYFEEAEELEWEAFDLFIGARASFSLDRMAAEPRLRPYVEGYVVFLRETARILNLPTNADSVRGVLQNSLLRANPTSFVTLETSERGGYSAGVSVGGGLTLDLRRKLLGFQPAVRAGVTVLVPMGTPRVRTFTLDYGFSANGVSFQQTDAATFTTSLGTSWGFQGGLTMVRPLSGRMEWAIDLDVAARHSTSTVAISTNPSTTSSQPGAIVFSTPAGSRTIVISTLPGVPSTVSDVVSNHELAKASGWSVGPVLRFGITF